MNTKKVVMASLATIMTALAATMCANRYRYGAWTQFTDPKKVTVKTEISNLKKDIKELKSNADMLQRHLNGVEKKADFYTEELLEFKEELRKADEKKANEAKDPKANEKKAPKAGEAEAPKADEMKAPKAGEPKADEKKA